MVEHDGGMPGYVSKITLVPEEKIAVLNNGEEGFIVQLRYSILDILLDGKNKDWIAELYRAKQSEQREDNSQKGTELKTSFKYASLPATG